MVMKRVRKAPDEPGDFIVFDPDAPRSAVKYALSPPGTKLKGGRYTFEVKKVTTDKGCVLVELEVLGKKKKKRRA